MEALTQRDIDVLDFERSWWKHAGVKEQAIKERFEMSATKYYQVLNELLENPAAMEYDPILVKRLKRLRVYRQRQRVARLLGAEYSPNKRERSRPMGRHSSGRTGPFLLSLLGWLLPYLLITAVVGVGVWMVADYMDRGEPEPRAASEERPDTEPTSEAPTNTPTIETPTEEPSPKKEEPKKDRAPLITEGVTIQVLNGTNDPEAGEVMAARLRKRGFQVVAVEFSSTPYEKTTVLWSFPDAEKAARALAGKYDWDAKPKPANLAATVSLHVVVGSDEANEGAG